MKALVMILCLAMSGCAPVNRISPQASPEWLLPAVEMSVDFWAQHGVGWEIADGGLPISVGDTEGAWGFYQDGAGNRIVISDAAEDTGPVIRSCIVGHELGHHAQLQHVEGQPSMMNAIITICGTVEEPECCWSDLDQAELDRVLESEEG